MAGSQVGKAGRTAKAGPNLQGLLLAKRGLKITEVHKEVLAVFLLIFRMISVRPKIFSMSQVSEENPAQRLGSKASASRKGGNLHSAA